MRHPRALALVRVLPAVLLLAAPAACGRAVPAPPAHRALLSPAASGGHSPVRAPAASAVPTMDTLRLAPTSGPPGTVVSVSGVAAHLGTGARTAYLQVCWDGCATGLVHPGVVAAVGAQEHFTLSFTVPATAWLGSNGPHPLLAGDNTISVLGGSAVFHLTGPVPARCGPDQRCASLRLTPDAGPPGTIIHVSGWLPLAGGLLNMELTNAGGNSELIGNGNLEGGPSGNLVQQADGGVSGAFVLPQFVPNLGSLQPGAYRLTALYLRARATVALASARLSVIAPTTWADLGRLHPLWTLPALPARAAQAALPAVAGRLARCGKTGIDISTDGGRTWVEHVATAGVGRTIAAVGLVAPSPDRCVAVALDPDHPRSVYAAFVAVPSLEEANLGRWVALETRDAGANWTAIPVPAGASPETFGTFLPTAHGVAAIYGPKDAASTPPYLLEQTTDGGRVWGPGGLPCPNTGPCVAWGPAPHWTWPGVCNGQPVLWSADRGVRWQEPVWPQSVCYMGTGPAGPYQLAALSPTAVALIGGADFPVLLSRDGGGTWQYIALPPLPGGASDTAGIDPFPGLTLHSDGRLTAGSGQGRWHLEPGGTVWIPGVSH